jgi:membrane protease YdiL (CAAX protease family)
VSNERLTGSDRRALFLWLLAAVAGTLFAFKYFFAAFPEASVNFQVSRAEASERARRFVMGLGENVDGYQSSIAFTVAEESKIYLEREMGLEQANRLMAGELSIWYWEVRYFRPLQKEEFRVQVSPAGRITGYEHVVEEARPGSALDRAAAESTARHFLTASYAASLKDWDFLPEEVNSSQRPSRLDWSFTWEKHGFKAKDAPYRLRVKLQGDRIGAAQEYLQVPEAWQRSYAELRSSNNFYAIVATLPYILVLGAAVWQAISLTRRGQARWKGAIQLGLVVAALLFLMQVNQWPLLRAGYDTKDSYASFVVLRIVIALLASAFTALTITLVLPAAEPLYRVSQPGRLRLSAVLTARGLRTKEFFNAAFVGLCLAAAHIGFVVAFYLVGRRFGVWAPQELNYSDTVNTAFPWISGIAIGLLASTNEEFTFRLFAIPYLQRLTKSRWIAVILPAFAWGFLHSNYPQEPGYIRGIEVGLIGIVAGIVMLRWGILSTLIWHYTVDAVLVGFLLIRSDNLYFKISGLVVGAAVVAPLAFAGISYLLRRGFETDESLLNRAGPIPDVSLAPPAAAEAAATSSRRYDALSATALGILATCFIVGGFVAWKLNPDSVDDALKLSISARDAQRIADETLRARGLQPDSFRTVATFVSVMDPYVNEYLRQGLGTRGVGAVYAGEVPGALWRVRYFRNSQPEEYAVILRPGGALHSLRHTLAENAPGASLSKDEAVARAESFLRDTKKMDLKAWHLVEATSDKKPHRVDHTLTWEEIAPLGAPSGPAKYAAGDAHARLELQVLGDEVANYRTFVKIPEEWRRRQEESSLPRTLYSVGRGVFFAGLGVTALVLYLVRLRSGGSPVPWKSLAVWGAAASGLLLLNMAAGSSRAELLARYPTEVPFKIFLGTSAIVGLLALAFYFGGITLLYGLACAYAKRAFGEDRLPVKGRLPGSYYRDALWIGLGGGAVLVALPILSRTLLSHWHTLHRSFDVPLGSNFHALIPAVGVLSSGLIGAITLTGIVALAASFLASELRPFAMRAALFLLTAFFLVGNWGNSADFAKQFIADGVWLLVVVWGFCRFVRFNILGCLLAIAASSLALGAANLAGQPNAFFRANAYGVLLAMALLFAWHFFKWRLLADSTRT